MFLSDPQLLQITILQAAREATESHQQTVPYTDTRCLIRYISFLAWHTLSAGSSFCVTTCFNGLLSNGSSSQILALYSALGPGLPETRDERSVTKTRADLRKALYRQYGALSLKKKVKTPGDLISRILERMVPWETGHLPSSQIVWENRIIKAGRDKAIRLRDAASCHVSIEQGQCHAAAKSWDKDLSGAFDKWQLPSSWRLPSPRNPQWDQGGDQGDDPWQLVDISNWDEIEEEEIMKEIHWQEEKSKRGWGSKFEVVVDGEI